VSEQIEGINWVIEAFKAGRKIHKLYVDGSRTDKRLDSVLRYAEQFQVPVERASGDELKKLSASGLPQGVLAVASPYSYCSVDEILEYAEERKEPPLVILLDGVEDPQNLGAVIRVAECAGVHGVILPSHRSAKVTPAVGRASAGAVEHVRIALVTNLVQTIDELKKAGLWVVGADASAPDLYFRVELPTPLALVFGGEGRGMRRLVREHCDMLVSIPMYGKLNSLNVATACAVVTYEAVRQRMVPQGVK